MRTRVLPNGIVALCLGLLLVAGLGGATVSAAQKDGFLPATLLAAERPTLDAARTALQRFDAETTRLAALGHVPTTDFESLRRQVAAIKPQLPGAQRALIAAIAKVRTAGKWTVEFDSAVLDALRRSGDTELIDAVRNGGGARALVERAATTDATQIALEMDKILVELRPTSALQRLTEPLLGTRVYAWETCVCLRERLRQMKKGLSMMLCAITCS